MNKQIVGYIYSEYANPMTQEVKRHLLSTYLLQEHFSKSFDYNILFLLDSAQEVAASQGMPM